MNEIYLNILNTINVNNYFDFYFRRLSLTILSAFFSFTGLGQNVATNILSNELCGCNSIIENDNVVKSNGKDDMKFYSNGKMKVEVKKNGSKKEHRIYYYSTGIKCKEEFLNFRMNIKKTIFYDTLEKRQMVCKGNLKF